MIRIQVLKRQGMAPAQLVSAQFGPQGGTIGRASTNTLVLDDPDRTVSRVHVRVLYRDGRFFVVDQGSNPMQCDGQTPGQGVEVELRGGERLTIGSFELIVHVLSGPASGGGAGAATVARAPAPSDGADPFANLLDGLVEPARPAAPAATAPGPAGAPLPDPFAQPAATDDPFADLLGPGGGATPGAAAPSAASPADDFSDLATGPDGPAESIDALFGLGPGQSSDPFAASPLADPVVQPNTAGAQDPLAAFSSPPPLQAPARADHLPIESFGYIPPAAVPAEPPSPAPVAPVAESLRPPVDQHPGPAAPLPITPAAGADQGVAGSEALLAAFLRGVGPLQQPIEALTPGLLERVGELLRSATEGTLLLLHTRQEIKREVRAQVTMIAAQANNPLKFSPTVEVALAHLLGPGVRGFMPAQAAMRDAYQDLRAHEFGVMVGIRAALEHVIRQFEPEALEQNISEKSRLDAIFTANRKARLWDQFVKLYAEIAREAEDDFHSLFGKAFLQAYEEQMARLKSAEDQ